MAFTATPQRPDYIGRFAPSPTGELHQGSLLTAVASYLDAHSHNGQWLVRMEDLDPPREQPGAAQAILNTLEAHQLHWHQDVVYQSQRQTLYQHALDQLQSQKLTYLCDCNRLRVQQLQGVYDNHCRALIAKTRPAATRLKVADTPIAYSDIFQGPQHHALLDECGDFVILRKDGLFAYQLAVTVDDIEQRINHVIRGCDLLSSTPRQLQLFKYFQKPEPSYGHLPVIVNREGQKLSKQTFAAAVDNATAPDNLRTALQQLGMRPPPKSDCNDCRELLDWGIQHWGRRSLPTGQSIAEQ